MRTQTHKHVYSKKIEFFPIQTQTHTHTHTHTRASSQIERVGSQDWSWLLTGCPSLSGGSIHPSVRLLPWPSYSKPGVTNYLVPVFWAQSLLHLLMPPELVEKRISIPNRSLFIIHLFPEGTEMIKRGPCENGEQWQFGTVRQNDMYLMVNFQDITVFWHLGIDVNIDLSVWLNHCCMDFWILHLFVHILTRSESCRSHRAAVARAACLSILDNDCDSGIASCFRGFPLLILRVYFWRRQRQASVSRSFRQTDNFPNKQPVMTTDHVSPFKTDKRKAI